MNRIAEILEKHFDSDTEAFAKMTGIDESLISSYTIHGIQPSADNIVKIAKALNVTCDYLLCNDSNIALNTIALQNSIINSLINKLTK